MCAIVMKEEYDSIGEDRIHEKMKILTSGFYLEWLLNDDCYMVVKNMYQQPYVERNVYIPDAGEKEEVIEANKARAMRAKER